MDGSACLMLPGFMFDKRSAHVGLASAPKWSLCSVILDILRQINPHHVANLGKPTAHAYIKLKMHTL